MPMVVSGVVEELCHFKAAQILLMCPRCMHPLHFLGRPSFHPPSTYTDRQQGREWDESFQNFFFFFGYFRLEEDLPK